jgi:small subunit ribosomal protein S8
MSNIVSSDPLADMFTRIRNAVAVRKGEINLPHSKLKEEVAKSLKANKFLDEVKVSGEGTTKTLTIVINQPMENARISAIRALSTPGRRMYIAAKEMPSVRRGRGVVIVSTSKGLMTGYEAKKLGVGGELLCEIY